MIKIVGCGAVGFEVVRQLLQSGLEDVEFFAIDLDYDLKGTARVKRCPGDAPWTGFELDDPVPADAHWEPLNDALAEIAMALKGTDVLFIANSTGGDAGADLDFDAPGHEVLVDAMEKIDDMLAVQELVSDLETGDAMHRERAAWALGTIRGFDDLLGWPRRGETATWPLERYLLWVEETLDTFEYASHQIARTPRVLEALTLALAYEDEQVRKSAALALEKIKGSTV